MPLSDAERVAVLTARITAAIAEFTAVREQILSQMGRAHRLAVYGVGGAAAVLTAVAGFALPAPGPVVAQLLVVAGPALIAWAYIGIVGEGMPAGEYLLDLGDQVRSWLDHPDLPQIIETTPLLRFEERLASRTHATLWTKLSSSLATAEMEGPSSLRSPFLPGRSLLMRWIQQAKPI